VLVALEMWELFQEMDSDASGLLEAPEVARLALSLGRLLSERELADAMGQMDRDNSGGVDFSELMGWWTANKNKKGKWVGMLKERQRERAWSVETKQRLAEAEARRRGRVAVVTPLAEAAMSRIFRYLTDRKLKVADIFNLIDADESDDVEPIELQVPPAAHRRGSL
jgi:hypothetical protein